MADTWKDQRAHRRRVAGTEQGYIEFLKRRLRRQVRDGKPYVPTRRSRYHLNEAGEWVPR